MSNDVKVFFFPKKSGYFGREEYVPNSLAEVLEWCHPVGMVVINTDDFPHEFDRYRCLERAFDYFNNQVDDTYSTEEHQKIIRAANTHTSATATDIFYLEFPDHGEWWYCDSFGWLRLEFGIKA